MTSLYAVDSTVRQWIDWRRFHNKSLHNEYDIFIKITEDEFSDFSKFKDAFILLQSPMQISSYLIPECIFTFIGLNINHTRKLIITDVTIEKLSCYVDEKVERFNLK